MKPRFLDRYILSPHYGNPALRPNAREAALVAVGLSCFVGWICVDQVSLVMEGLRLSYEADDRSLAERTVESGRAVLSTLIPLLLVFLFAAWSAARRGSGLRMARTAVVAAVGVWLVSLTFLKYLIPPLIPVVG